MKPWTLAEVEAWVRGDDLVPGPDVSAILIERATIRRLCPEAPRYDVEFCQRIGEVYYDRERVTDDEVVRLVTERIAALWARSTAPEEDAHA